MCLDIDLLAVSHSKVTSDNNRFAGLFLTFYCKALSFATFNLNNKHNFMISILGAGSGVNRSTHPLWFKKQSIYFSNKYSACK